MDNLTFLIDVLGSADDYKCFDLFGPDAIHLQPDMLGESGRRYYAKLRDMRDDPVSSTSFEEAKTIRLARDIAVRLDKKIRSEANCDEVKRFGFSTGENYDTGLMIARCVECYGGPESLVRRNCPEVLDGPLGPLFILILGMLHSEHSQRMPQYRRKDWPSDPETLVSGANATARHLREYRQLPELTAIELERVRYELQSLANITGRTLGGKGMAGLSQGIYDALTPSQLSRKQYKYYSDKIDFPRNDPYLWIFIAIAVEQFDGIDGVMQALGPVNYGPDHQNHDFVYLLLSAFIADCYVRESEHLNMDDFDKWMAEERKFYASILQDFHKTQSKKYANHYLAG